MNQFDNAEIIRVPMIIDCKTKIRRAAETHLPFNFDAELAAAETNNVVRLFNLHLERCDDEKVAQYISSEFLSLGEDFKKKALELSKENKVK
jgi:hypothetical protein